MNVIRFQCFIGHLREQFQNVIILNTCLSNVNFQRSVWFEALYPKKSQRKGEIVYLSTIINAKEIVGKGKMTIMWRHTLSPNSKIGSLLIFNWQMIWKEIHKSCFLITTFCSPDLAKFFSNKKIWTVGMLRTNRCKQCALPSKQGINKLRKAVPKIIQ